MTLSQKLLEQMHVKCETLTACGMPEDTEVVSWEGRTRKHHFKKVKKKVRFVPKLDTTPSSIVISDAVFTNSGNLTVERITNRGFVYSVTGIQASENAVEFHWEAQK